MELFLLIKHVINNDEVLKLNDKTSETTGQITFKLSNILIFTLDMQRKLFFQSNQENALGEMFVNIGYSIFMNLNFSKL